MSSGTTISEARADGHGMTQSGFGRDEVEVGSVEAEGLGTRASPTMSAVLPGSIPFVLLLTGKFGPRDARSGVHVVVEECDESVASRHPHDDGLGVTKLWRGRRKSKVESHCRCC